MASMAIIPRRYPGIFKNARKSFGTIEIVSNVSKPSQRLQLQACSPMKKNFLQSFSTISSMEETMDSETFQYDPDLTQKKIFQASRWNQGKEKWDPQYCQEAVSSYTDHLHYLLKQKSTKKGIPDDSLQTLLSSKTTERALKAMTKMNLDTQILSKQVRHVERLIGKIGRTPLTDSLSLSLLEANGKSGNIGRTISLLNLRKVKGYRPCRKEFNVAIQAIHSAGLYLRKNRNVFLKDDQQPEIDNPTRWLDAILVNMSERGARLDTKMANIMLSCYCSTGRSGKATHYFYKVTREYLNEDGKDDDEIHNDISDNIIEQMPVFEERKTKVRMRMRQHMPPYYKVPSDVKLNGELVKRPSKDDLIPKIEWEKERDFSLSLTSAFAFADSLTHGACGHEPINLDLTSWNTLVKACCYRGAMWRALEILNDTLPKQGITPDAFTYNTIIAGLARLGDKDFSRELLTTMTNNNIPADKYTIQGLVDGYLNAGDISGAVTLVQDMFNQHQILPPYTTHLKIIEFAIGNGLVYEAKRQVFFIQQLWKYKPRDEDPEEFQKLMSMTQKNRKLSESSLKRLFAYFGEELGDDDFF